MKQYVCDVYPDFRCRAGACAHTCCRGWEVDIDADTLAKYDRLPGETGELIRAHMERTPDGARFALLKGDVCPFLRKDGLCELICREGEDILCGICRDHPRWRVFGTDRVETGLGLCCEAAAELILFDERKAGWVLAGDDGADSETDPDERELLDLRGQLTGLLQDRGRLFADRLAALEAMLPPLPAVMDAVPFLMTLEYMEADLPGRLRAMAGPGDISALPELPLEQFAVYLIHRHLPEALSDGDAAGQAALCVFLTRLFAALLCAGQSPVTRERVIDTARLLSSEIEYSDVNPGRIVEYLETQAFRRRTAPGKSEKYGN